MIALMANCILPGRLGELVRPMMLHRHNAVPLSMGLASVTVEGVFDMILLLVALAIILCSVQIDPDIQIPFGHILLTKSTLEALGKSMLMVCLTLICGIILITLRTPREIIIQAIRRIPESRIFAGSDLRETIQKRVCIPLADMSENFAAGLSMLKSTQKICQCVLLTVAIWMLTALTYYIMAIGCPRVNLSFVEMIAVMVIISFFISLPSIPGAWGLWEAGGMFALSLFGIQYKDAAGFVLISHAVYVFPVILAGLFSAMLIGTENLRECLCFGTTKRG